MTFYRVTHKATGRVEIVDASDRRVARNAIALDAFEVEVATAEDGFKLAKEGRSIIVAGAVKDPDQPALPLNAGAPGPVERAIAATGVLDPDAYLGRESFETVDAGGEAPPIQAIERPACAAAEGCELAADAAAAGAMNFRGAPVDDEDPPDPEDTRLLTLALAELEIVVSEKIVSGWAEEERLQAWDFANASALTDGVIGGPELPDFLRIYSKAARGG